MSSKALKIDNKNHVLSGNKKATQVIEWLHLTVFFVMI